MAVGVEAFGSSHLGSARRPTARGWVMRDWGMTGTAVCDCMGRGDIGPRLIGLSSNTHSDNSICPYTTVSSPQRRRHGGTKTDSSQRPSPVAESSGPRARDTSGEVELSNGLLCGAFGSSIPGQSLLSMASVPNASISPCFRASVVNLSTLHTRGPVPDSHSPATDSPGPRGPDHRVHRYTACSQVLTHRSLS